MPGTGMSGGDRGNRKTALLLAAVALAFFVSIMLNYWLSK